MTKSLENQLHNFLLTGRSWSHIHINKSIEVHARRDAHVVKLIVNVCGQKLCDINSYSRSGNRRKAAQVAGLVETALKKWATKTKKQSDALAEFL